MILRESGSMIETSMTGSSGYRLHAAPPLARFVFRGPPEAEAAAGAAYGLAFPEKLNRAASIGERGQPGARVALRIGPDELLLITPEMEGAAVAAALEAACAGLPHALVEVSDRHLGLVIEGPQAADLLNSGCPLDLDEAAFPVGMVTRTLFHKAEIVLWRMGPTLFRIEVWRSFAPYVEALLEEAAACL
jgi:sarcosine oxidase, subunit gamma